MQLAENSSNNVKMPCSSLIPGMGGGGGGGGAGNVEEERGKKYGVG